MAGTNFNLNLAKAVGAIDVVDSILNKQTDQPKKEPMLSNFLGELKSPKHMMQLAKPYLFYVQFIGTDKVFGANNSRTMSFLCHRANIPGYSFDLKESFIGGIPYSVPVGLHQDEFSCSFYIDRQHNIPQVFEDHKNEIMNSSNFDSNYLFKYKSDYQFSIELKILDMTNQDSRVVMSYLMQNCMIKTTSFDNLDWAGQQQIHQMHLVLNYEYISKTGIEQPSFTNPDTTTAIKTAANKLELPLNFDTIKLQTPQLASAFDSAKKYVNKAVNIRSTISNFF